MVTGFEGGRGFCESVFNYSSQGDFVMMRQMLSLVEKIPLIPAAILIMKAVWAARLRRPVAYITDQTINECFESLHRDGVCIVEKFLPVDVCDCLRKETRTLMEAFPDAVHCDPLGADRRLFLGPVPTGPLAKIFSDERLASCASVILGAGTVNLATLVGHLTAVPGNSGSGGGWHRDSFANQFKAMIYLSDVGPENGPFQYILGSHNLRAMIRDQRRAELGIDQTRITEGQIARLLNEKPQRLASVTGLAGTLILADTTGLHRGTPIVSGERYALTNYYYPSRAVTAGLTDHFKPILGVHVPYDRTASSSMESVCSGPRSSGTRK